MKITECVKNGFADAKKNFGLMKLRFILGMCAALLTLFFTPENITTADSQQVSLLLMTICIPVALAYVFIEGGSISYVYANHVQENSAEICDFVQGGKKNYWKLLGLDLVTWIMAFVTFMLSVTCLSLVATVNPLIMVPLFFLSVISGIYFVAIAFSLAPYAAVVGESKIWQSIKMSTKLANRRPISFLFLSAGTIILRYSFVYGLSSVFQTLGGVFYIKMLSAMLVGSIDAYLSVAIIATWVNFYVTSLKKQQGQEVAAIQTG